MVTHGFYSGSIGSIVDYNGDQYRVVIDQWKIKWFREDELKKLG